MSNDLFSDSMTGADLLESLAELESNTADGIHRQRAHLRITARCKVTAQPGNASQRSTQTVRGVSGDVSAGGCKILFAAPVTVGDIYWLTFDKSVIDIQPMFARCVRCLMIREDAFEAGFQFFQDIALPDSLTHAGGDLLA